MILIRWRPIFIQWFGEADANLASESISNNLPRHDRWFFLFAKLYHDNLLSYIDNDAFVLTWYM